MPGFGNPLSKSTLQYTLACTKRFSTSSAPAPSPWLAAWRSSASPAANGSVMSRPLLKRSFSTLAPNTLPSKLASSGLILPWMFGPPLERKAATLSLGWPRLAAPRWSDGRWRRKAGCAQAMENALSRHRPNVV